MIWALLPADCRATRRLAQAFVDDETAPPDTSRVLTHLRACGECRAEVEAWRRVKAVAGMAAVPLAPQQLRRLEALIARLQSAG